MESLRFSALVVYQQKNGRYLFNLTNARQFPGKPLPIEEGDVFYGGKDRVVQISNQRVAELTPQLTAFGGITFEKEKMVYDALGSALGELSGRLPQRTIDEIVRSTGNIQNIFRQESTEGFPGGYTNWIAETAPV